MPAEPPEASPEQIHAAVERALPLLEKASAGSAEQRTCFTCHGQALPVFAIAASARHGFSVDTDNLKRQLTHTRAHLRRGRKAYQEGKGQGGGVDTAGYALWTLEEDEASQDEVTAMVTEWLLKRQNEDGYWACSSKRPPSEASDWTTTYLALRALSAFGTDDQQQGIEQANAHAQAWLAKSKPQDTEDLVFHLLSLGYVDAPANVSASTIDRLRRAQRENGGWAQKEDMESDAYATATVLYALHDSGAVRSEEPLWKRGVRFLLDQQLDDGSWKVKSRSVPFQKYFESGFPHGDDQFISTTATSWATLVLLQSLSDTR